ncbi:piggyBac transposable element-derived protein 4-like [Schistocerca serialis cubense]|uniref:piggyBac transposable element-derived protein 4-like n=1 Tax=Schistocerca serialis cubense TaxID=2023355 RepID=UPI00214E6C2D|nr:piggyBac transposable element-derived protein 4-like [Schistocerca serialis cubense]
MSSQKGITEDECYRILFEEIPSSDSSVDSDGNDPTCTTNCASSSVVCSRLSNSSDSRDDSETDDISENNILPSTVPSTVTVNWSQETSVGQVPLFIGEGGVIAEIKNKVNLKPIDLFCEFFFETLIKHIVFQTNLYATQKGKIFVPTNEVKIKTFIGINLYMGITKKPSYRHYWSTDPDLGESSISKLLPVKRFSWVMSNLHLNDNSIAPDRNSQNYDKLYNLRPFLDHLNRKFQDCYKPHQKLAIDEAMVKFKGWSSLIQYMRDKPIKRGYKVWMLCDQSSYNLKFDVYTG